MYGMPYVLVLAFLISLSSAQVFNNPPYSIRVYSVSDITGNFYLQDDAGVGPYFPATPPTVHPWQYSISCTGSGTSACELHNGTHQLVLLGDKNGPYPHMLNLTTVPIGEAGKAAQRTFYISDPISPRESYLFANPDSSQSWWAYPLGPERNALFWWNATETSPPPKVGNLRIWQEFLYVQK